MRNELKSAAFKDLFLKYFILFTVIVAGIFAGFFISVKSGLTERYSNRVPSPSQLNNTTTLEVGEQFPSLEVYDLQDNPVDFSQLLEGRYSIVAFVSNGCTPCTRLITFLDTLSAVKAGDFQIVLLARDAEPFRKTTPFQTLELKTETYEQLNVDIFPTILGVGADGRIRFVSSGFTLSINDAFLEKNM